MQSRLKVAVIFGGMSEEYEVSLMSARSILSVLSPENYDVTCIGITRQGQWFSGQNVLEAFANKDFSSLRRVTFLPEFGDHNLYFLDLESGHKTLQVWKEIDAVFPVLHGPYGEDGRLQGLFELMDMPYVGADVLSSALGMDKGLFKKVMRSQNIPIVDYLQVKSEQIAVSNELLIKDAESLLSYPMYVKPVSLGSSVGITRCENSADLNKGLSYAANFDHAVLIEQGVDAREIEVSLLGTAQDVQVSIPGEIEYEQSFYSYDAKYTDSSTNLVIPAELSGGQIKMVQDLALKTFKAINCRGMARVDFLLDRKSGEIFVSEINTIPGFTHASMFPKLWEASGIPYAALVEKLIDLALKP